MASGTILIVDSDRESQRRLNTVVSGQFDQVIALSSPNRVSGVLKDNDVDLVLIESNFTSSVRNGNEGIFWIREILNYDPDISIVVITSSGDIDLAVRAIREGAVDFILKPWDEARLLATINTARQLRESRRRTSSLITVNRQLKKTINNGMTRIIGGASPTMINVMNIVHKVAGTGANVLITGENGTGKELVAREIHRLSDRSSELMVSVDMGSVTETLFESEMFGHVKGAFTDARDDRKGRVEEANGGTLFLDEIGNLSLTSQAKLLSVLQNRQIVRVGSNKPVDVDIRLICATNCDLPQMVKEGRFREDLLYRINTILIEVPPLRDRVDDIPVLANYFLRINSERYGKGSMKLSTAAMEKLSNHPWPGNVRELQHAIEKAVILCDSPVLKPSDFLFNTSAGKTIHGDITLEEMEKRVIADSLKRHGNNLSVVAAKLGITRQTLYNKMSRYHLQ